mgnify:CR=1 FL=1
MRSARRKTVYSRQLDRVTEQKIRKLIRNELARQYMMEEGIFDNIKNPFKKVSDKAKKYIAEKAEEILNKIKYYPYEDIISTIRKLASGVYIIKIQSADKSINSSIKILKQ